MIRFTLALLAMLLLPVSGCGSGTANDGSIVSVHLTIQVPSSNMTVAEKPRQAALPAEITLLQLEITGPGLDPISKTASPSTENKNAAGDIVMTIQVPPGSARRFTATAFDQQGTARFQGEVISDIVSGSTPEVILVLKDLTLSSVPQHVSAVQTSWDTIQVSWDPVEGADSYTLYFASVSGAKKDNFNSLPDGNLRTDVTSPFTISLLDDDKTYCIVVTATRAGKEGIESTEACITVVLYTQIEITPKQGSLAVGTSQSFSAVAKTFSGSTVDNVLFVWQSLDPSIASIDGNGVVTGHRIGFTTITAAAGAIKANASVGVVSPDPGESSLNLSGSVHYEDKPYNANGFTGVLNPTPVRGATVHVIAIDGFETIATGATGLDGTFSFSNIDNSMRRGGVYLQVFSKTDQIEIRNNVTKQTFFSLTFPALDDSNEANFTSLRITATATSGIGGAFNILDVLSRSVELIEQAGGLCTPPAVTPCSPPLLTAYWEPGSRSGTYYDPRLDAVFILGGDDQGDTDEYDDAVIAYQYAHFAIRHFSKNDSLGGGHFITDNDQDIRLSWSSGWASFFSSAVLNDPFYVDTSGGTAFSFNIESYDSSPFLFPTLNNAAVYTTNEIAVAGVLWDLFDSTGSPGVESHDTLALGFQPIWQTVLRITSDVPATMESFWLQFESLHPRSAAGLQSTMQERKMEFFADSTEAAETALVVNGPAQHHTLYKGAPASPENDEDVIPFSVQAGTQYTLETLNLTNGADTLLFVSDQPGSNTPFPGLLNDNLTGVNHQNCGINSSCPSNGRTTLSSSITWTATSDATLYAHVKRSQNAPPSTGQFGSYEIQLRVP